MIDREKQIEEMATIINTTDCSSESFDYLINSLSEKKSFKGIDTQKFIDRKKATALYNAGYRKMDEITLKLNLGDRSAEEIEQIAEAFNKAVENEQTLVAVPSDKENLKTIAEDLYPLTIIRDRYTGVYSGASFTAWNLDYDEIPYEVSGDDISCYQFWSGLDTAIYVVGKGATVEEAYCDLLQKMGEQNK